MRSILRFSALLVLAFLPILLVPVAVIELLASSVSPGHSVTLLIVVFLQFTLASFGVRLSLFCLSKSAKTVAERKTRARLICHRYVYPSLAVSILVVFVVNWFLLPSPEERLKMLLTNHLERCIKKTRGATVIVSSDSFRQLPAPIMRQLFSVTEQHPKIKFLKSLELSHFARIFRKEGLGYDALILSPGGHVSPLGYSMAYRVQFLSTTGIGYSNFNRSTRIWFFSWLEIENAVGHGSCYGKENTKATHYNPFRLLPSNPDYQPLGVDKAKFDDSLRAFDQRFATAQQGDIVDFDEAYPEFEEISRELAEFEK